jgi:hypothetical protein
MQEAKQKTKAWRRSKNKARQAGDAYLGVYLGVA